MKTKNPRLPARVPSVCGLRCLEPRPSRPSVLPPGAGDKADKAVQPKEERADDAKERYVDQAAGMGRQVHAATVRRHDDGDWAAIPAFGQTHGGGLRCA